MVWPEITTLTSYLMNLTLLKATHMSLSPRLSNTNAMG